MTLMQGSIFTAIVLPLTWVVLPALGAAEDVEWLVVYDGEAAPQEAQWTRHGAAEPSAEIVDGALHLVDNAEDDMCYFRATWEAEGPREIVVEARVRVVSITAWRGGTMHWPWSQGSPISVLVSNGQRQEGLALCPERISTFLDRFYLMPTTDNFHVYRLVISGNDMSIYVDGELKIRGKDAFWKPVTAEEPFIQFGSNAEQWQGEAYWDYVRLGVREMRAPEEKEELKITVSDRWEIPPPEGVRQTRPYLYNVGEGLLLISVAQGPDAVYEPYGVLKSTDEGKTWTPIEGLQEKTFAPQPMIRLDDGKILGASRWIVKYQPGNYTGFTYIFDRNAESFEIHESKIMVPEELGLSDTPVFDRDIFNLGDDTILAVIYDMSAGYLLKTTDLGRTWEYVSTIGAKHEPGVEFLSDSEAIALLRQGSMVPLHQVRSHDGGQTWSEPVVLEEGSVDADVVYMSNGVLACSYGRPGCNIMFSTDKGETWGYHRVISERGAFSYTAIREVSPGRLLYVYDALAAVYIDVESVE